MQFHYVVFYDTDKKKWGVELDVDAYFSDGHVWDESLYKETSYGFRGTEDDSDEALLDQTLMRTLYYLTDIIPIPKEYENV
jgi:hypothetical protein